MHTVNVVFEGVNAYVPHTDENKLMVVMPNAVQLGRAKRKPPNNRTTASHIPMVGHVRTDRRNSEFTVHALYFFPSAELEMRFWNSAGDEINDEVVLGRLRSIGDRSSFELDSEMLSEDGDPVRLAAHCRIRTGAISILESPCALSWHRLSPRRVKPEIIAPRIKVVVNDVASVTVAQRVFGSDTPSPLFKLDGVALSESAEIHVGNVCAEDVLAWPTDGGPQIDGDFSWLYQLRPKNRGDRYKGIGNIFWRYLLPKVAQGSAGRKSSIDDIFSRIRRGGPIKPCSGLGCQCNGVIAKAASF